MIPAELHAHVFMDGLDYKKSAMRFQDGVDQNADRSELKEAEKAIEKDDKDPQTDNRSDTTSKASDPDQLKRDYYTKEWCRVNHDDRYQFEMLCLEGASVGLSWRTILLKREGYRRAFHGFDIEKCAAMTDEELEALIQDPGIIRHRGKIFSVRKNAQAVKRIQEEFGSFDAYVWSFTDRQTIVGGWESREEIPAQNEISQAMSSDMKKRGIGFAGPVITYSFMQAIGMVDDHLVESD